MQALWMVLASFWFALMAVGIKFASHSFGTFELVFYRGLVSIVFMGIVVRASGSCLHTPVPLMHLWRSTIGVVSLGSWFYAIAHLPLATAMTLNYMSGVWVAAIVVGGALLFGKRQARRALVGAVLMGFVGVVMTLRPTMEQDQLFAGLIGMLSGLGAALAYIQVTALGKVGEPEERTVFYFSVSSAVVGAVGIAFTGFTPWSEVNGRDALWVIPIGILASLGQWCMTRAYRKGATLVVASLQYSGIVFGVIFSLVLFGDHIPTMGWLGISIIFLSGLWASLLRPSSEQRLPKKNLLASSPP